MLFSPTYLLVLLVLLNILSKNMQKGRIIDRGDQILLSTKAYINTNISKIQSDTKSRDIK